MKKTIYILTLSFIAICLSSCDDFLEEKSKDKPTVDFLQKTPQGLLSGSVALYNIDRSLVTSSESTVYAVLMDRGTDIDVFRGGGGATFFRYDNLNPTNSETASFWRHQYSIIGKANEIITYSTDLLPAYPDDSKSGEEHAMLKRAIGEASLFRARAYFQLLSRYDRINLDTTVVDYTNIDKLTFKPALENDVLNLIYRDLDKSISYLGWNNLDTETYIGRFTRGTAKHVKAKVAMWKGDWDEAIKQVDDIDTEGIYELANDISAVFDGAKLVGKDHNGTGRDEVIFAHQFSRQMGGGASDQGTGHRMSLTYTPNYSKIPGFRRALSLGGYAWGRSYPNAYLISLYDQTKDKRYSKLFKHSNEWVYVFEDLLPKGKQLGQEASVSNTLFMETKHVSTLKYFDKWTQLSANETSSFKDVIVYRVAETYLLGAEAYMRKNGGNDSKALYYYNKTWMRAGNDQFTGTLTEDIILDEHARELNLEGSRFEILKRTGKLLERVRAYGGEVKADAISSDYTQPRKNIKDHHVRWPIPQSEIDQMGGEEVFPQNTGYQK